ncbi:uncharacterized protein LOC143336547 [Chaetodon auriga]|uniref:uncharacterized protein LOC143336547 n=1 Tax=Chaetodon auriga TaxID=39042 RepID=UPI004032E498
MRLLLLSLIRAGVKGDDGLMFQRGYDITFPCEEDAVCFHIWHFSTSQTSDHIAIVSNGEIQTAKSEDEDSKCTLTLKDLTAEDVGRHRCQQRPDVFSPRSPPSSTPEVNVMPGKMVSLQCILLTYVELGHCNKQLQQVSLTWVDEAGAEIQEDSQHQIKRESACDVTLTITFQSPENKKFRCQATVDGQVQTSVELRVRVPALKGRGRGFVIEPEPENQGGNHDAVAVAVGVVGCVVLTALVAAFAVKNRRRTRNRLQEESCYTTRINNITNADDVVYAEVILPVGSDLQVHEHEDTEYACVRYLPAL